MIKMFTSGRALYVDDAPRMSGMLHAAIGTSAHAHARIASMDLSAVRTAPGVLALLTAADVPGLNDHGPVEADDPIFASDVVEYIGQSVFAVVADSVAAARGAVALASIEYEVLDPTLDIDTALARGRFLSPSVRVVRGDPAGALAHAPRHLSGTLRIGGQEHLYLEGQVAIAIPEEDESLRIVCSTQHPSEVQRLVARACGLKAHDVRVECPRLGGGFGGKETQASLFACIAALGARATGRAVKLRLNRRQDFAITGKRHDFRIDYQAGFGDDGRLHALKIISSSRCGRSADLSIAVNTRALLHFDNAYYLENVEIVSHRLRTHTASNTAFRGFGAPQAILAIEHVLDDVARAVALDPVTVRRRNFYSSAPRDTTHYGMKVEDNVVERLVDELEQSSRYQARRKEASAFNATHRVLKRGVALTPVKFGISFTQTHLNQAGALVNVYTDGTVRVNHGGVEMGQGLHAKVARVVAAEFGIDVAQVRPTPADTDKVPNAPPTAASASSDLNGKAAAQAARAIRDRLANYLASREDTSPAAIEFRDDRAWYGNDSVRFADLVADAYQARISLSATGFYRTPLVHFDPSTCTGRPFFYFVYGAAVAEVTVDVLTGETRLERVDILQDAGRSIDPTIDQGQIEGAFLQGAGWLTSEELVWDDVGRLVTDGPDRYKIPTSFDWPRTFDVRIVDWNENAQDTIFRSKGIGEPPIALAAAVFLAIKDAIAGPSCGPVALHAPATPVEVLRAVRAVAERDRIWGDNERTGAQTESSG